MWRLRRPAALSGGGADLVRLSSTVTGWASGEQHVEGLLAVTRGRGRAGALRRPGGPGRRGERARGGPRPPWRGVR